MPLSQPATDVDAAFTLVETRRFGWLFAACAFAGEVAEISEALAAGHTIGDIRRELALDGLEVSYSNLRTHVARLRKSHPHQLIVNRRGEPPASPPTDVPAGAPPAVTPTNPATRAAKAVAYDPLANLRDRLTRRPGFQYDDRPPDEKKLI